MAETKGFEPSRRFLAYSLSRGAPSTTRPHLRGRCTHYWQGKTRGKFENIEKYAFEIEQPSHVARLRLIE